jgi:parallel beta-helix repeat protein
MTGRMLTLGGVAAATAAIGGVVLTGDPRGLVAQVVATAKAPPTQLGLDLQRRLGGARGGETIMLASGDYGHVRLQKKSYAPAIRITGAGARFTGLTLWDVAGVQLDNVTVATPPGGRTMGIDIRRSHDIILDRLTVTGSRIGIGIGSSNDVSVLNTTLTGLQSDGIIVSLARKITIRGNSCSNFSPIHSVYDESRKLVQVGDHPDCIQSYSRPKAPPTADILVESNRMEGDMQGIFFGNHVRGGIDDGGFDRITIRNNIVRVTYGNGIALQDARDSVVAGNRVSNLPRYAKRVRTWVSVKRGERNLVCGNIVADFPNGEPTVPCP